MTNPVARLSYVHYKDALAYVQVMTFCPGCKSAHPFTVQKFDNCPREDQPVWDWNGDLLVPTFSPSMLCHGSYHFCKDEDVFEPCTDENLESCGHNGHRKNDDGSLSVFVKHGQDPAWGDCHSFLENGKWRFLSDCAHPLKDQTVEMIPLPDYLA